jgi:hypothetical protein
MERVYFADHRGTQILRVDYSGLHDPEEIRQVVRKASAVVKAHPPESLLVLVDVSGVSHSLVTAAVMQQGVAESRPHVRARAVVGLRTAAGANSFEVAAMLFGSPMERFDDHAAALDWLLTQAPTPP